LSGQRIQGTVTRGAAFTVSVDGATVQAFEGETVATVLLAEDREHCYTTRSGKPRGMFCNMGSCYECLVAVDGGAGSDARRWRRACVTAVEPGMRISTGRCWQESPDAR
jgi:D-hydroxyproline dehydrogenase subunit gamma